MHRQNGDLPEKSVTDKTGTDQSKCDISIAIIGQVEDEGNENSTTDVEPTTPTTENTPTTTQQPSEGCHLSGDNLLKASTTDPPTGSTSDYINSAELSSPVKSLTGCE